MGSILAKRKDSSAKDPWHFREGLPTPKEDSCEEEKEKIEGSVSRRRMRLKSLLSQINKLRTKIFYIANLGQFWRNNKDRN